MIEKIEDSDFSEISEFVYGDFMVCLRILANGTADGDYPVRAIKISEIKKIQEFNEHSCLLYIYKDDYYLFYFPLKDVLLYLDSRKSTILLNKNENTDVG